jgi:hypothetical protein
MVMARRAGCNFVSFCSPRTRKQLKHFHIDSPPWSVHQPVCRRLILIEFGGRKDEFVV